MSTSFCYGCLYAARKEVQGVGLTWSNMWEEGSPGDSMTLGLILLMIAFDGCVYATVGYMLARYTNSGNDPRALRAGAIFGRISSNLVVASRTVDTLNDTKWFHFVCPTKYNLVFTKVTNTVIL